MNRRTLLRHSFALTPLATVLLAACGDDGSWPEGMVAFKWDRDTCTRCKMSISDRRFACQIRGGANNTAYKFDDIGCATTWRAAKLKEHPWINDPATRFWVAEFNGKGEKWLPARNAHYQSGKTSPMGYNFAAFSSAQADTLSFEAMCQQTSGMWPADCQPGTATPRSNASAPA